MSDQTYLVSVIIPAYNRAGYIAETIQSVLNQTYTKWELIVVDDGSTDDTYDVVLPFLNNRIKYYRIEHSGRLGRVRNYGIIQSSGELIAFHDSDDLWRPDKLEIQVGLLTKNQEAVFVIGNGDEFGENFIQTPDYENLFVGSLFLPILEKGKFCFYVPTFIFKREALKEIGMLDENSSALHDITFFFRMSWRYTGVFTNERLIRIRKHRRSRSSEDDTVAYRHTFPMLREFSQKNMINKRQYKNLKAACYYQLGLVFLRKNEMIGSFNSFLHFSLLKPLWYKGYVRLAQSLLLPVRSLFQRI